MATKEDVALNPAYSDAITKLFSNIAAPTVTKTKSDTGQLQTLVNTMSTLSTPAGAAELIKQIFKVGNIKYAPNIAGQVVGGGGRGGKSSYQTLANTNLQAELTGQAAEALNRNAATAMQGATALAGANKTQTTSPDLGSLLAIAGIETGVHAGADALYKAFKAPAAVSTATETAAPAALDFSTLGTAEAATTGGGAALDFSALSTPELASAGATATEAAAAETAAAAAGETAISGTAIAAGASEGAASGTLMSTLGTYALPIGATIAALYAIDKYTGIGKDLEKGAQHLIGGIGDLGTSIAHGIESAGQSIGKATGLWS